MREKRSFDVFNGKLPGALQQIQLSDDRIVHPGRIIALLQGDLRRDLRGKEQQKQQPDHISFLFHRIIFLKVQNVCLQN